MNRKQSSLQWMVAALLPLLIAFGVAAIAMVGHSPTREVTKTETSVVTGPDLYVNPDGPAASAVSRLKADPLSSSREINLASRLAKVPTAIWLLPEEHPVSTVQSFVSGVVSDATVRRELPVFVVYGLPGRDCGNESSGGISSAAYSQWVQQIALGIGKRSAWVILEPDSLALSSQCSEAATWGSDLAGAVDALTATSAWVYLDAGHSDWLPVSQMASILKQAHVEKVRGFATNVSNFNTTAEEESYAENLSAALGGAHFVIDTSRNGNGSSGQWCNPPGRALGELPDTHPINNRDALLWIKQPGESDGQCNGGPKAGVWWGQYAVELATNAGW